MNLPIVLIELKNVFIAIFIGTILLFFSMKYFHKMPHRKLPKIKVRTSELVMRVIFTGSLVAGAVYLAKIISPQWGGLLASFPAAFSATVILVIRKHGVEFTSSLSRSLVNANLANIVFVVSIFILVPLMGVAFGMIASYLLCLVSATISYRYVMAS